MSSVEDQLRAAGRAVADEVTSLPELRLAPARPGLRLPRARGTRRWTAWAAPLTAVAVIAAVAAGLVLVRGTPGGHSTAPPLPSVQGTPPSAAQVPRYYIAASLPAKAIIGDLRTGKQVAVNPQAGHVIAGVAGSADDSAFVVDMPAGTDGQAARTNAHEFFLYRAAGPGDAPLRRSPLPLTPSPSGEGVLGVALSPDGSRLAVLTDAFNENQEVLRLYAVATGKVQREWTMPSPSHVYYGGDDNSHSLSWTGNGQELAFRRDINLAGGEFGISVFILDVTRPGHDLRADSRIVTVQSNDNQCNQLLVTPDGKTVICGVKSWGGASASCPNVKPEISEYSAETGRLVRVLYEYGDACLWGYTHLYWSNQSGSAVVAGIVAQTTLNGPPGSRLVNIVGLYGPHGFAKLPVHLPADIGTIINNDAPVAF